MTPSRFIHYLIRMAVALAVIVICVQIGIQHGRTMERESLKGVEIK